MPANEFGKDGGPRAWELAMRYSSINTNPVVPFQAAPLGPAQPGGPLIPWSGALNDVTFDVNWYLSPCTKFQMNYIVANCNRGGVSSTIDTVALQAQLDF